MTIQHTPKLQYRTSPKRSQKVRFSSVSFQYLVQNGYQLLAWTHLPKHVTSSALGRKRKKAGRKIGN